MPEGGGTAGVLPLSVGVAFLCKIPVNSRRTCLKIAFRQMGVTIGGTP